MPNRRRRKLSRAMSAVAALAVASPFAAVAAAELVADSQPAPQHREFTQAAVITDLPNELLSALSSGLSQFGINMPPLPTGVNPAGAQPLTGLTTPGLASPGLTSPGLTSPGLTSPGLTSPGLTSPGLTSPGLTTPGATAPGLATPGLATPSVTDLTTPGLVSPALTDPAGTAAATVPGLTDAATGLTTPGGPTAGLTTPGVGDLANPALTPGGTAPIGLGTTDLTSPLGVGNPIGLPGEQPIAAPIGLGADTYPILGDPSLGGLGGLGTGMPASKPGLISDLSSAANSLGAGQAVDLLKGVLMPTIMGAIKSAGPAAAAAPAAVAPAAEAAAAVAPVAAAVAPAAIG